MKKGMLLDIEDIQKLNLNMKSINKGRGKRATSYLNIPCSYDIETSSFIKNGEKVAITYSHAFNINGYSFLTRTWDGFKRAIELLREVGMLHNKRRIIIYVHNLSYEFQFMKKHLDFTSVFCNGKDRDILYAITDGIEFRCSYMLTGFTLAKTAENLTKFKIKKLEEDFDYKLIRTPETKLTEKELQYILNDVVIIEYAIREAIEESGDITKIPYTNTGYVREYCRKNTLKSESYKTLMSNLTLETEEYIALRQCFAGGFTHASKDNVNKLHENVASQDFSSSYPAVMMEYEYPISKGELYKCKDNKDFIKQINNYCCMFYIELYNINCKANEAYISHSKCRKSANVVENNGRVDSASMVGIWLTDIDFRCLVKSYSIESFRIGTMYRYKRGRLPKEFMDCIMKLYEDKTVLKDVSNKIAEYVRSKGMLNSCYGMIVMDIIQEDLKWNDDEKEVIKEELDIDEKVKMNNKDRKRFLYYPWGVWITAYARYNLFNMIIKLEDDYIYADTDSVKYLNKEKNEHLFIEDNERIKNLLYKACDYYGYDRAILSPKDITGKTHTIGLWDREPDYNLFKTLGAKRYLYENDGITNLTVSGINKKTVVPYLLDEYGKEGIFDVFDHGLSIPAEYSGKITHTYIDVEREGYIKDYQDNIYEYKELSSIHLDESGYDMRISDEYFNFIEMIKSLK